MKALLLLLPLLLSASVPNCEMLETVALWHAGKSIEQSPVDCKQLTIALKQLHVVEKTCPPIELPSVVELLETLHKKDCR